MAPTRLLVATTNLGKVREIREVLGHLPLELLSLQDLGPIPEPEETGATFQDNARLKVRYYAARTPLLTVADDSGLIVDALGGEPGVHSARFLRADASYPERFVEIYRRLAQRPDSSRAARFVCAAAVARGPDLLFEATGSIEGEIAPAARGTNGFGYDPIFLYPPYARTLAEVTQDAKLRVAHRGEAFRKVAEWLSRQLESGSL